MHSLHRIGLSSLFAALHSTATRLLVWVVARHRPPRVRQSPLTHAQKMRALGLLAGAIVHEYSNHLMAIRGFAELLVKGVDADRRARYAATIVRVTEEAATLVSQLSAFRGDRAWHPQALDLNELVVQAMPLIERLIGKGISVELSLGDRVEPVYADHDRLKHVVCNLALDGRDAMHRGGTLTIATGTAEAPNRRLPRGPHVYLRVRNTGGRLDSASPEHIFDPFFAVQEPPHTGRLRLAIVYAIVEQLGGDVVAESEFGKGSTFTVFLPRFDTAASEDRQVLGHTEVQDGTRRSAAL